MRTPTPRDFHRFVDKMDRSNLDGCWLWTGGLNASGYGLFSLDGRSALAHRVSIQWLAGSEPEGMMVCHKCDNPPCVNPDHLLLGTALDNMRDRVFKGRGSFGRRWRRRLNPGDIATALTLREQGRTLADIADYFGLVRGEMVREFAREDSEGTHAHLHARSAAEGM